MIGTSLPKTKEYDSQESKPNNRFLAALKWFWRFSNFYGEYTILPPSERHKFLTEQHQSK